MTRNNHPLDHEKPVRLSTLWIFVLFNIIFRDIHELFRPGFLAEVMTGTINGSLMTEELLLLGGVMIEIPIAMVLLSHMLPHAVNRWANLIAAPLTILAILANGTKDLDDLFFVSIQVITLIGITWYVWKWRILKPELGLTK